ncbi:MAG: hypothetical protein KDJ70_18215, partial [Candidatus Competibacteraceae bacterium]|nr:hypothetical protein [Candidatus Competibacteraceae bacterium]
MAEMGYEIYFKFKIALQQEEFAIFTPLLQKFAEKSPVTVMVRGLLERLFDAEKIDAWFENVREVQYIR